MILVLVNLHKMSWGRCNNKTVLGAYQSFSSGLLSCSWRAATQAKNWIHLLLFSVRLTPIRFHTTRPLSIHSFPLFSIQEKHYKLAVNHGEKHVLHNYLPSYWYVKSQPMITRVLFCTTVLSHISRFHRDLGVGKTNTQLWGESGCHDASEVIWPWTDDKGSFWHKDGSYTICRRIKEFRQPYTRNSNVSNVRCRS